jgi:cellulose synthase/poly-beta-1,6-N-acetylglucosamine synthase-like glycosyltransferase
VVTVTNPSPPRKKHALSQGIDAAEHDLLAFTDADCRPPPDWLSILAGTHAKSDRDLVLVGYSPLRGTGLLGRFVQYETLLHALYATAAIGLDRPYMAVGRNLSYPRSVFEAVDGFEHSGGGQDSMSGDDDLFVQAVHRQDAAEVQALFDDRTFVPSSALSSWTAWVRQRRRHVSAGRHYPWSVGAHLTLCHASLFLLWIAPLFLEATGLGLLATGLLVRHTILGPAAEAFRATVTLAVFPLWELGYVLSRLILGPVGLLRPPEAW